VWVFSLHREQKKIDEKSAEISSKIIVRVWEVSGRDFKCLSKLLFLLPSPELHRFFRQSQQRRRTTPPTRSSSSNCRPWPDGGGQRGGEDSGLIRPTPTPSPETCWQCPSRLGTSVIKLVSSFLLNLRANNPECLSLKSLV